MIRKTSQREAIQEVFTQLDRPLAIDEVLAGGRKLVASLNQATVYRNLKSLVQAGWLLQLNHPSLGTLYERSGKGHHHHFHCHLCNQLYCLSGCPLPPCTEDDGYIIEGHELFLSGICPLCNVKSKTSSSL